MSASSLRAWRAALASLARDAGPLRVGEPSVTRLVLDVEVEPGVRALVTLSLHDGTIVAVDERGEQGSSAVRAALGWLEGLADREASIVRSDRPAARTSLAPPASSSARTHDVARETALSLVRSGLAGARRGAMDDALRRARAATDLRVARWTARFEAAIAVEDVHLLAQLARGVLQPTSAPIASRVDLRLLEIAREHVDGGVPRGIVRRHLLDLASGVIFVEEHDASSVPGSIGPMPRTLEVGLAEVLEDPGQPVLRALQYTTSPVVAPEAIARMTELAARDRDTLAGRVEAQLRASPAFAEPVVLFSPARWEPGLRALDADDRAVPLSDEEPAACLRLAEIAADRTPSLLVLRAAPRRGVHAFVPLSCVVEDASTGAASIVRLRG